MNNEEIRKQKEENLELTLIIKISLEQTLLRQVQQKLVLMKQNLMRLRL